MCKCLGDVRVLNLLVPHKWMGKSTRPHVPFSGFKQQCVWPRVGVM
jgi:hypothetical protein